MKSPFLKLLLVPAILLSVFTFTPHCVSAHGDGVSLEQKVNSYLIDIGYDPKVITAQERMVFDFDLKDTDDARAAYDRVWVRLEQEQVTVLATSIARASVGATTLVWVPPSHGTTELYVRFEKGDVAVAEYTFPLDVVEAASTKANYSTPGVLAGIFFAVLIFAYALYTRSQK